MLGFATISDLVIAWALRRGESVGVKRNDGIDERLAAAMDRLGRVVWAELQEDSAWRRADLARGADTPLTKHRVQVAIEAAADRDRRFWYDLQEAAGEVQALAREDPASARAAGVVLEEEPAAGRRPAPGRRSEVSAGAYLTVAAVAAVVLVGFLLAVHLRSTGPSPQAHRAAPAGNHGSSGDRSSQQTRIVTDRSGLGYGFRSAEMVTVTRTGGRAAPPGSTFLGLTVPVTNSQAVALTPAGVTVAVPVGMTTRAADGSCRLGRAAGRVEHADCLVVLAAQGAPLAPGETRTVTFANAAPVPAGVDLTRVRVAEDGQEGR